MKQTDAFINTAELLQEISNRIKKTFKVTEILLFGSYARGDYRQDSDIDLIVVLDEDGVVHNHSEKIQNRLRVSRIFRDIKERLPMDILVYTREEWRILQSTNSSFFQEISRSGISIA